MRYLFILASLLLSMIGVVSESHGKCIVSENHEISHGVAKPPKGFRLAAHVSYLEGMRLKIERLPIFAIDSEKIIVFNAPPGAEINWSVEWEQMPNDRQNVSCLRGPRIGE